MYLERLEEPKDIKELSFFELKILAAEIREALLEKCSRNGGHLASNLGIVELTIALHYVFNSPEDKIVFDVSHQCYTHKMLTGRAECFLNEDLYSTINGYTNPDESPHDVFRVGHTATSISLASGLAVARNASCGKGSVIAVIGDGSLSGGEALEGLDFVGSELSGRFVIVVNDNQMSIANNHGGLYKSLADLRATNGGSPNNIFTSFGLDYRYVADGNDIAAVINMLKEVNCLDHPVVVHVNTIKGYGYEKAEDNPEMYHWVRPFELKTGNELSTFNGERYDRIIRDYLIEKMKQDASVQTILAAVPDALSFSKEYRDMAGSQIIDVGIAEEHAIAMSAGIAKNGGKPVFATMSTFYQRTYDQISQELCLNNCSATLIVVNASVYASNDVTHIGIFDIPLLANIPNLVYLCPTNKQEYLAMLDWAIDQSSYTVALRAPRNGVYYASGSVDTDYSDLNKFKIMKKGSKVAIFALGDFYQMGERVVELLLDETGVSATLINPRYASGLDTDMMRGLLDSHNIFVTLEDGVLDGGFGQKVASFYGCVKNALVLNYGLKKEFLDRFSVDKIMKENRLEPRLIVDDIEKEIG